MKKVAVIVYLSVVSIMAPLTDIAKVFINGENFGKCPIKEFRNIHLKTVLLPSLLALLYWTSTYGKLACEKPEGSQLSDSFLNSHCRLNGFVFPSTHKSFHERNKTKFYDKDSCQPTEKHQEFL